jgi:MYXO-CTERM domain-containing protein
MDTSKFSKLVAAGLIGATLTFLPVTFSASAQTQPDTTVPRQDTPLDDDINDNGSDWGWLGLLGLIGLAGLARKRQEPTRYRDPNDVSSSSYR